MTDGAAIPAVSVVVPVYRNAETLAELHRRLADELGADGCWFEVIFVDDACPSGSGRVAAELAALDPRVRALRLTRNVGQHAAVLKGLAESRGEWTVVMDGDLQDPPEAVPMLLAEARSGQADVVFAARRGRYESRFRLLTSRAFKRLLAQLANVPPDAGLFVALRRPIVDELLRLDGRAPSVVAMIGSTQARSAALPVVRAPRPSGRSAYSTWARLRAARQALAWGLAARLGRCR